MTTAVCIESDMPSDKHLFAMDVIVESKVPLRSFTSLVGTGSRTQLLLADLFNDDAISASVAGAKWSREQLRSPTAA